MWKLTLVVPAVFFLAGCKDTVIIEDNGPDQYERERAMRDCVGQYFIEKAEESLRIACTEAIYGGQ